MTLIEFHWNQYSHTARMRSPQLKQSKQTDGGFIAERFGQWLAKFIIFSDFFVLNSFESKVKSICGLFAQQIQNSQE